MITLKEYLVGMDRGTPNCAVNTMVMGDKNDLIHIEFSYKDEKVDTTIKYDDITHHADDDKWTAFIKSSKNKSLQYKVQADYTHTGHIGYSTNNMMVYVINDDGVVKDQVEPRVNIVPYNTFVYGTVSKDTIQI